MPRRLRASLATYNVYFAISAEEELEHLYQWLVARAPLQGGAWFKGLELRIFSLQINPYRYPRASAYSLRNNAIRQMLYGRKPHAYRIFYRVNKQKKEVHILHLRHGARRLRMPRFSLQ